MLATAGIDLQGCNVLLMGNGPSSWWIDATRIEELRNQCPSTVVVACNRTGPRVHADFTCAVDRAMVKELLSIGAYNSGALIVGSEVFIAHVREDLGELPPGVVDAKWRNGGNVFGLEKHLSQTGTGVAAFETICACKPDSVSIIGFDGAKDPRTRWQGSELYKNSPCDSSALMLWNADMLRIAKHAIATDLVGGICEAGREDAMIGCSGASPEGRERSRSLKANAFLHAFKTMVEKHCEVASA